MTQDEIKQLIQAVVDSGIAELEVQRGDSRVRIRRNAKTYREVTVQAPAVPAQFQPQSSQQAPAPHVTASSSFAPPTAADPASDPSLVLVKAPIVGTFYESPAPTAPAFVKVGDTVHSGQVLCIIESMKLMNEIESEVSGVVVAKLVENTSPVEYGEALFSIRPI